MTWSARSCYGPSVLRAFVWCPLGYLQAAVAATVAVAAAAAAEEEEEEEDFKEGWGSNGVLCI